MVYDISDNRSTAMAMSKELFNSCRATKTGGEELTEKDFRKNVDLAWRITTEFAGKGEKANKVTEPEKVDHPPCEICGSTLFVKTGVCYTCALCASSTSCS